MALHAVLYTPLNLGLQSTAVPIWHSCQLTSIASRLCRRCLFPSPRRSRAADTVHNLYYRHRCPVHGTAYASLFLHPSASVITQLGQSCSAATRLSLHIPPEQVVVDAAQQKLVKTFLQIWVSCVLLHMSYILDFLL